nr:hypothetical protein [Actinomycetota bacterium]
LYDRLVPYETQGVAAGGTFTGTVGMYVARLAVVLGRDDDALAHFAQANSQLRTLDAPFWQSRNQVEWARLLISRGADADATRAREMLYEAESTAAAYGCSNVERKAHALLASLADI